jgi:Zn-dependent protease with chaperone function
VIRDDLPVLPENNVSPEHPLAELATLLAGLALVGLGLFALAWLAVEGAVRWLPAAVEERVFTTRAFEAASPAPLDALLRRIAAHWPERGYALRIGVIEDAAPNAFALPGGQILVTRALLAEAGSENELAFVLAHELGHVAGRDPLRALGRGLLVRLALAAVGGAEGAGVAASAASLGERAFSREQESAADRFALSLVAREYGHVAGAAEFLRRLPDAGPASGAEHASSWLTTHPRSAERVGELAALAEREGWASEGPLTPLPEGLAAD